MTWWQWLLFGLGVYGLVVSLFLSGWMRFWNLVAPRRDWRDKDEQQTQDQILKRGLGTEVVANVVGGIASGAAAVVVQQGLTKLGSNDKRK